MWHALILLAEDAPKPPAPFMFEMLLPIGLVFLFLMVVVWPAQRQEKKAREALLTNLKKNDKVITTSGIYGTVVSVAEKEDEVTVKVDDNVRLKMLKSSIARNLTNEEAAKAAAESKGK